MGTFFSKYKTFIFIAVGAIIVIGIWLSYSSDTPSDSLLTTEVLGGGLVDKELVDTLLQLRSVTLSAAIFSEPAFTQLQDFGTEIIPEPIGRPNPFAPLGVFPPATSSPASSVNQLIFSPQR